MRNQDSVIVNNEALADHGRAGRVVVAEPFKDEGVMCVNVQLDGDGPEDLTTFVVADLRVI